MKLHDIGKMMAYEINAIENPKQEKW